MAEFEGTRPSDLRDGSGFKVPGLSITWTAGFEGTRSSLGGRQALKVPSPKKHGTYRGRLNSHVFFFLA